MNYKCSKRDKYRLLELYPNGAYVKLDITYSDAMMKKKDVAAKQVYTLVFCKDINELEDFVNLMNKNKSAYDKVEVAEVITIKDMRADG